MVYIKLIYYFFIVGIFSFGGAYSAIPIIRDVSKHFIEINDEMLSNFIAIAESTPGSISVNLATFIGTEVAGFSGAIVATIAEVLPAFLIIIVIVVFFKEFLNNKFVKESFSYIRPCIIGIIMSVAILLLYENFAISNLFNGVIDEKFISSTLILFILLVLMYIYKKVFKKKLGAIKIIILGLVVGVIVNLVTQLLL